MNICKILFLFVGFFYAPEYREFTVCNQCYCFGEFLFLSPIKIVNDLYVDNNGRTKENTVIAFGEFIQYNGKIFNITFDEMFLIIKDGKLQSFHQLNNKKIMIDDSNRSTFEYREEKVQYEIIGSLLLDHPNLDGEGYKFEIIDGKYCIIGSKTPFSGVLVEGEFLVKEGKYFCISDVKFFPVENGLIRRVKLYEESQFIIEMTDQSSLYQKSYKSVLGTPSDFKRMHKISQKNGLYVNEYGKIIQKGVIYFGDDFLVINGCYYSNSFDTSFHDFQYVLENGKIVAAVDNPLSEENISRECLVSIFSSFVIRDLLQYEVGVFILGEKNTKNSKDGFTYLIIDEKYCSLDEKELDYGYFVQGEFYYYNGMFIPTGKYPTTINEIRNGRLLPAIESQKKLPLNKSLASKVRIASLAFFLVFACLANFGYLDSK